MSLVDRLREHVLSLFRVVVGLLFFCHGLAYFTVHQEKGALPIENGGEAAAMFCWTFLLIVFLGPGSWSLARLFSRREPQGRLATEME